MSKRLTSVLIIIAILIGMCVWEQLVVDMYLKDVYNQALSLQEYVEDYTDVNLPDVETKVFDLERAWAHHEDVLCFLVNHEVIKDMSTEISKLKSYMETNQEQDFKATISVLLHYTHSFRHVMGISLQNLF